MTPEGRVRQYLRIQARKAGLEHRKLRWLGRNGAPDEFLFAPRSLAPRAAFVEVKREGEQPEPHQAREHKRLRDAGFDVWVVDSLEDCDEVIQSLTQLG